MNRHWIRKTHRWLALLFSISALMASGSGFIHNLMSRTQAPPPAAKPSGGAWDARETQISVPEALKEVPGTVRSVNLRGIGGEPWYQIFTAENPVPIYVSGRDGHQDPSRDEAYAAEIASAFLGGKPVRKTDYLTTFNREYIAIFRILPVYRFDAEDGLGTRVYVSTVTGSVTRHTDNHRQWEADLFSTFHKLAFIPNKDLRDLVLTLTTGGIFVASLLGIVLFFLTRPSGKRKQKS